MQRLSWVRLDDDTTVVVKVAIDAEQRRALHHEAETLRSLRHPGVVQFVGLVERPDHLELHTASAGRTTLADHHAATLGAVAGVAAAVAGVIADLHDAGIAHGNIAADHVIVGEARHPVLCSFASSGPAGLDATMSDLIGLAELIETLVDRTPATAGRLGHRQRRALGLAAAACRGPGASARAVAAMLAASPGAVAGGLGPDAAPSTEGAEPASPKTPASLALPQQPAEVARGTRTWRDRVPPPTAAPVRPNLVLAAVIVLGALALTAMSLRPPAEKPARPERVVPAGADQTPATGTAAGEAAREQRASPTRPCPPGTFDIDNDGCDDAVSIHGNLVLANETWFEAGRPGDVVEVGDWNCDGTATPALLRPATGAVFVFDAWATEPTSTTAVDHAPGAVSLVAVADGGCPWLHTIDSDGRRSSRPVPIR